MRQAAVPHFLHSHSPCSAPQLRPCGAPTLFPRFILSCLCFALDSLMSFHKSKESCPELLSMGARHARPEERRIAVSRSRYIRLGHTRLPIQAEAHKQRSPEAKSVFDARPLLHFLLASSSWPMARPARPSAMLIRQSNIWPWHALGFDNSLERYRLRPADHSDSTALGGMQ